MARPPSSRELQVMSILWELGRATVADVRQELNERWEPTIEYRTVQTHLLSLEAKQAVRVDRGQWPHRYEPAVTPGYARTMALNDLLDTLFAGSPEALLGELLSSRVMPSSTVRQLHDLLSRRLEQG